MHSPLLLNMCETQSFDLWSIPVMCFSLFLQPSFLHTDFNRWRDEDDSEEEDTAIDDNFEAVSKVILLALLK